MSRGEGSEAPADGGPGAASRLDEGGADHEQARWCVWGCLVAPGSPLSAGRLHALAQQTRIYYDEWTSPTGAGGDPMD